jgi:hypothetical protein
MVERFDCYGMRLDDHASLANAYYVRAHDYDALAARLAEAEAVIAAVQSHGTTGSKSMSVYANDLRNSCGEIGEMAADEMDALEADNERLRVEATKLAVSERCAMDEIERLCLLLREARACVGYMASGMTHAPWVTEMAQATLARIDAAMAAVSASVEQKP